MTELWSNTSILVSALERIDPYLRFLTKATGKTTIPLQMLRSVLPKHTFLENYNDISDGTNHATISSAEEKHTGRESGNGLQDTTTVDYWDSQLNKILVELSSRGVLQYLQKEKLVGFPLPPSFDSSNESTTDNSTLISGDSKPPPKLIGKGLHGSSEAVARRRMKVLMWTLERNQSWISRVKSSNTEKEESHREVDENHLSSSPRTAAGENDCEFSRIPPQKRMATDAQTTPKKRSCLPRNDSSPSKIRTTVTELKVNFEKVESDKCPVLLSQSLSKSAEIIDESEQERARCFSAFRALHNLFNGHNNGKMTMKENMSEATSVSNNIEVTPEETHGSHMTCKQNNLSNTHWLPFQASYAGSNRGRESLYGVLSNSTIKKIPIEILRLFNLDMNQTNENTTTDTSRSVDPVTRAKTVRLFHHQARAIEAAMNGVHTVVCTGTGSGKSLCFLLPVLAKTFKSLQDQSYEENTKPLSASIVIFPTKALAQDQYTKLHALIQSLHTLTSKNFAPLRVGVIDGDTPHSQRDVIASECQIILTNPDTIHAAILPNRSRTSYKMLLERVDTVVLDEAHVYEGAFGAHVALVLARLKRICHISSAQFLSSESTSFNTSILFIACSATMIHPEHHFRILCPIADKDAVCVITPDQDGSPCAPKHFFVWNPPILNVNGNSTNSVFLPEKVNNDAEEAGFVEKHSTTDIELHDENDTNDIMHSKKHRRKRRINRLKMKNVTCNFFDEEDTVSLSTQSYNPQRINYRRHAADETAFLLAKAITTHIRCIAFCKTRSLVEWVYERTISILRSKPDTSHLITRLESYRGGYSVEARRSIEERLFKGDLWGVVGTNALELGVDVGGIDLTLHCGYPGSKNSLLQQSGRAGRGRNIPSCAIMICFSSPSEQFLWRNPKNLLNRGVDALPSMPINNSVIQGHLLCAGREFPLTGDSPVSCLLNDYDNDRCDCPTDEELLGFKTLYKECINFLIQKSLMRRKVIRTMKRNNEDRIKSFTVGEIECIETHPIVKNPWKMVNLRSIEPLSYSIVDISHPMQGGKTDKIHDEAAVIDTIPYSRVFYHAFPGAVIMHRGSQYKIESMESPPLFLGSGSLGHCGCTKLIAFAKPVCVQYSTQALSVNQITVVKQMEHAQLISSNTPFLNMMSTLEESNDIESDGIVAVAGRGIVTVKRTVHGYKKLSHVNRIELSRSSIILPPMEFDTHALWIDADASYLKDVIVGFDAGVHALSHAMVAVSPLYTPCTTADINCDHTKYECTRILLFDTRAGGSGITAQLYSFIIECVQSAIDLLNNCTSCYSEKKYDGGCPGCLQCVPCDNFHQELSRSAGILVGRHILERLRRSTLNQALHASSKEVIETMSGSYVLNNKSVQTILEPRGVIIGRASWLDNEYHPQFAEVDE